MKAIFYKVEIQDDVVHSYTKRVIREFYIPKLNMCFNEEGYIFESTETRSIKNKKEIEISDCYLYKLYDFLLAQQDKNMIISEIFESI
jgi:hypothetical protein